MSGAVGRSGGSRVGAGRKAQDASRRWLGGNAGKRGRTGAKRPDALPTLPDVAQPASLSPEEALIWQTLAPLACAARTLTEATSGDLAVLCALEVELAEVKKERRLEGWTTRGMFLAKEFRGLVQRVEAKRRAFRLAPIGKEMVAAEAPKDEWSDFEPEADGPVQ